MQIKKRTDLDVWYGRFSIESKNHMKLVIRHIWEDYTEKCEDIRLSIGMK